MFSQFETKNFKEICEKKNISMRPAFISSVNRIYLIVFSSLSFVFIEVQTFFTQNSFRFRFDQKPIYTASIILIVLSFVITLSLCFYVKSKRKRLNSSINDYEYTRLHNASFELGTSTESESIDDEKKGNFRVFSLVPNSSPSSRLIDESHLETDDHLSFSDYRRLLNLQP